MPSLSRRTLFAGAVTAGAAAAATGLLDTPSTAAPTGGAAPVFGPVDVTPADARYADLVWGTNRRWVGTPDHVVLVGSADQVVRAVQDAVAAGRRVAVRSGGHCYENFVSAPDIRVVIDLSQLNAVYYDPGRRAFAVEPGALLGDVYKTLYKGWGVTIPGGSCPTVGIGGHIAGGGYGPLSRRHGLTVDHLYAVEVVVVDDSGTARKIVATREKDDPNRDLWWAHTGGGGGNFGVVTKYWFRSPDAATADPRNLLPRPPSEVLVRTVGWSWASLDQAGFSRLLRNFGAFYERNSGPDSPYATLFSQLKPQHKAAGSFAMTSQIDAAVPNAQRLLDDYVAAVSDGVKPTPATLEARRMSWLHSATQWPGFTATDVSTRFKAKSAYMRRAFTEPQIAAFHRHLTRGDYDHPVSLVMITAYGGKINTVAPDATAVAQRDSIIKLHYVSFWTDEAEDPKHLAWIREFYRDVYADSGGVPVPNSITDGTFINYADVDLADPAYNTSGVGWERLYYKDNYPRLQAVKARFDPRNVFRHALSPRLPR
ncbi:FAD-binding oxidoreductase [Planosporangium thailandense]|uniref:FAD-binding oxidoreductase n=1 Tax=Planosporangium thailandense TaxID=765197 RepID=A0ABX0XXD4_9ACTN|nr:FAD-binding oxidoreductase [Planosporangium thailandense]NJC70695.1 FAD-binding oxidoreductase [Planosporangium thailandense]